MQASTVRILCVIFMILSAACQQVPETDDKNNAAKEETQVKTEDITIAPDTIVLYPHHEILGKVNERRHDDFVEIEAPYASRSGMYLRSACYEAFRQMADHARDDGIDLVIISAMRNFDRQKLIWEAKWRGDRLVDGQKLPESHPEPLSRAMKILEYSSMPGSSRHHWGTDIDINALTNEYFSYGKGLREFQWLQTHASQYGFCQVYTDKSHGRTGYEEEKWHWSYLPIARQMTKQAAERMSNADYSGFLGDEAAKQIDVLNKYVLGIDPSCR